MNQNLFHLLAEGIVDPKATAIETPDGHRLSYADILAASARMAHALVSLGVVPGDRVAAQVEKSVPALMLYLASLRAGAVFLPLNTAYTPAEIAYFIGDATPRLFVCDPAAAPKLAPVAQAAGRG